MRRRAALAVAVGGCWVALAAAAVGGEGWATPRPQAKSDAERRVLEVLENMWRTQRRGMWNVPTEDGRLLRVLVEATGARQVVEIGTSNGYSGLWMALGLLATDGKLTTFEIDPRRARLARQNFQRAGVDHLVTVVEGDAHKAVRQLQGPVDLVFLDADKAGYRDYLEKLLPLVRPGGLVVAHNTTSQAAAMKDFLEAVTTDPALETVFVNRRGMGISLTLKKRGIPPPE